MHLVKQVLFFFSCYAFPGTLSLVNVIESACLFFSPFLSLAVVAEVLT